MLIVIAVIAGVGSFQGPPYGRSFSKRPATIAGKNTSVIIYTVYTTFV